MKSSTQASRLASRQQASRKRAERSRRGLGLEQLESRELMAADWGTGLSFTQGPFLTEFQPGDEYYVSYGLNVHHLEGSSAPQDHIVTWGMRLSPDKPVTLKDQVVFDDGETNQLDIVDHKFKTQSLPAANDSFWDDVQPDIHGKATVWLNLFLKDTQTGVLAWAKPQEITVLLDKPDIVMRSFTAVGDKMTFEYDVRGTLPQGEFNIGLYRSSDNFAGPENSGSTIHGYMDTPDLFLESLLVAGDLAKSGKHTFSYKIGPGKGALVLPGNGAAEVKGDYFVLAVADHQDKVKEDDGNAFNDDNTAPLAGGYYSTDGVLLVHGTDQGDIVRVNGSSVSAKLGGKTLPFSLGSANRITIRAHNGNDTLKGGAGDDILIGAAGNDYYEFGSGNIGADVLFETLGDDRLDFSERSTAVEVSLGISTVQKIGLAGAGASSITLGDATKFEQIYGTELGDILRGNKFANRLSGRGGDDTLWGRDGADWLSGGSGKDTVMGEEGSDNLLGGAGNDILDGLDGDDTFTFESPSDNDEIRDKTGVDTLDFSKLTQGVTVNLGATTWQRLNSDGQIKLLNSTLIEKVIGSKYDDKITGNTLANNLQGGRGNDQLFGRSGDDLLDGGEGADGLYGGVGLNTLKGGGGSDRFLYAKLEKSVDFSEDTDVAIHFEKGAKNWNEAEIEQVDDGLKVLHLKTMNKRLLQLPNGDDITFVRGDVSLDDKGNKTGFLAENLSDGRIVIYTSTFTSADPVKSTVVHEIGHNWDNDLLAKFKPISGWQTTSAATHTPAVDRRGNFTGWYYKSDTAKFFPAHNAYYAMTNPYEDIATSFEVYFFGSLEAQRKAALDAYFAKLRKL